MTAKVAILIDGAYFLRRLRSVRRDIDSSNPHDVARSVGQLVSGHLNKLNEVHRVQNPRQILYRCFYYDAWPYLEKGHTPISKRAIDYSRSDAARFRLELFDALRARPNLALRLGQVTKPSNGSWVLNQRPQAKLLRGEIAVADLEDSDFSTRLTEHIDGLTSGFRRPVSRRVGS